MSDLVMVATMVAAIVILAAYVAFCDRVVTGDDDAAPDGATDAAVVPEREPVV